MTTYTIELKDLKKDNSVNIYRCDSSYKQTVFYSRGRVAKEWYRASSGRPQIDIKADSGEILSFNIEGKSAGIRIRNLCIKPLSEIDIQRDWIKETLNSKETLQKIHSQTVQKIYEILQSDSYIQTL